MERLLVNQGHIHANRRGKSGVQTRNVRSEGKAVKKAVDNFWVRQKEKRKVFEGPGPRQAAMFQEA